MIADAGLAGLDVLAAKGVNPDDVTPGVVGFIAIFLIAVAVVFLVIDMTRRIRRVRYRAEIAAKLDAEQAAAEAAAAEAAQSSGPRATGPRSVTGSAAGSADASGASGDSPSGPSRPTPPAA
jgi:hypothetical protein